MGTKANPGSYDCYGAVDDDEPLFTLRAKDPLAPVLVKLWVELRKMTRPGTVVLSPDRTREIRKHQEALRCASDMVAWRVAQLRGLMPSLIRVDGELRTVIETIGYQPSIGLYAKVVRWSKDKDVNRVVVSRSPRGPWRPWTPDDVLSAAPRIRPLPSKFW